MFWSRLRTTVFTGLLASVLVSGLSCTKSETTDGKAVEAVIQGRKDSKVKGTATFSEVAGGIKIDVHLEGAPPGQHGVHIHEKGDCSAEDFSSAGSHFNPDGKKHGLPGAEEQHAGDLGNMEVQADGTGHLEVTSSVLTVAAGKYSVVGKALIVHEKPDDGGQPTGNAGSRIGCGEIRAK